MFDASTLLILVPGLPLLAAVVTAALGKRVLGRQSHWPAVLAIGLSFVAAVMLLFQVEAESRLAEKGGTSIGYEPPVARLWTWASIPQAGATEGDSPVFVERKLGPSPERKREQSPTPRFQVDIALQADPLTAIMLCTVTFVSMLVAVYSIGYMHDDPGYWRFFSYIALFVFSMTMLVAASNFVLLYVFWEAVGLCSYLLIGFWFQKPAAAAAGKKAFLVNRVGDFAFALGLFLLWTTYGTLDFHDSVVNGSLETMGILGQTRLHHPATLYVAGGTATAICLLLLTGACGKSAQVPLHIWLPDAMEGPTPVSALIHAATMVTAGVYLVARCTPLFMASPDAQRAVAIIGGVTALVAAITAVTQTDLKRILAYSTISQLGYMFLGLGAATFLGIAAGMFHLFTHAFFKALLFLGAGSVMHAMGGVIDIRRFGGLRRRMPTTYWTFLVGCLALAGFPGFAGFFSKDQILLSLRQQASVASEGEFNLYEILYYTALFTALLTAFYTFRALLLTFHGPERIPHEAGDHAHESPRVMTLPLVILAIGSAVVGGYFEWTHGFYEFLARTPSLAILGVAHESGGESHVGVALTGAAMAGLGIAAAWFLYVRSPGLIPRVTSAVDLLALYRLSSGKFYFDAIYYMLVLWPLDRFARLCAWVDQWIIDGLVDLVGAVPRGLGAALRPLQGGMIQFYALCMVLGLLTLIAILVL